MLSEDRQLTLDELVYVCKERVREQKDLRLPYVGLEHIAQEKPFLLDTASSDTSVSTNSVFEPGDILFGKLRPNLRKSLQVDFQGYCSTDILVLRVREQFHPRFVARVFQSDKVFDAAVQTSVGTRMPRTSWGNLKRLYVFVPPLPEQRRIAEILDAADDAIRQSERVIAKLREAKKGLLHDLLTRGLDADGNLRDPEAHPEQFKDSPLGRIPREWAVSTIRSCIEFITDYRGKTPPYSGEGIPAISAENIGDGRLKSITKYVTPEVYRGWLTRGYPLTDDVIFTTEAPVGEVALVPGDQTYLLTRRLMALRPDITILRKHFLYWVLLRMKQLRMWDAFTHGSTVPRILKPDLLDRLIPLPEIQEQDGIASILDAHEARILAEEATLDKLRQVKRGLMDDLLTGQVRVSG